VPVLRLWVTNCLLPGSLLRYLIGSSCYQVTRSLTHLLTHLLTYLLTYLLAHSLTNSLTYLLTDLLTHLFTHLLTYLLTHSLTHSGMMRCVTRSTAMTGWSTRRRFRTCSFLLSCKLFTKYKFIIKKLSFPAARTHSRTHSLTT
jgi:hypothetical protein